MHIPIAITYPVLTRTFKSTTSTLHYGNYLQELKHFIKMLKDVGMTMPKVQEQDAVYAGQSIDDGMRKEQHEGKGKGLACDNHDMRNPIKKM